MTSDLQKTNLIQPSTKVYTDYQNELCREVGNLCKVSVDVSHLAHQGLSSMIHWDQRGKTQGLGENLCLESAGLPGLHPGMPRSMDPAWAIRGRDPMWKSPSPAPWVLNTHAVEEGSTLVEERKYVHFWDTFHRETFFPPVMSYLQGHLRKWNEKKVGHLAGKCRWVSG